MFHSYMYNIDQRESSITSNNREISKDRRIIKLEKRKNGEKGGDKSRRSDYFPSIYRSNWTRR